ncbi:hypothetical protein [Streptomyces sp. NPDC020951]|uniref:hypothetical protein n=1 Tax=Streptomyces sp. NPDC020951 TaxID=3365104 RepID=UPI00379CCE1E
MRSIRLTLRQATVTAVAATSVLALTPTPGHTSPARPAGTATARYSVPLYAERSFSSAVVTNIVAGVEYDVLPGWEEGETFPDGYCGATVAFNNDWRFVVPVPGEVFGWTSVFCIN